jgi:acetyl/propionyl-CoA carboxylase alpha subunit
MPKLERRYTWQGTPTAMSASIDGDRLQLVLGDRTTEFRIVPGPTGAFVLVDGDRVVAGHSVATADAVWIQLDGRTWRLEPHRPARPTGVARAASGEVLSPMTGTVRKVFVTEGATVAAGAPLLVVEAMKMEFTVTAPIAGRVAALRTETGASVEMGALLVEVEPDGGSSPAASREDDS